MAVGLCMSSHNGTLTEILKTGSDGHPIIENYVLVRHAPCHQERRHASCAGNIIAIIVRPASLGLSPVIKRARTFNDCRWR